MTAERHDMTHDLANKEKLRLRKAVDALASWINFPPYSLLSREWRKRYDELSDEVVAAFRRIDPGGQ
ncbi:MAG: hypothetical protein WAV47_02265 [Blastocatellia bacterium]